jgi:hypothetical protein
MSELTGLAYILDEIVPMVALFIIAKSLSIFKSDKKEWILTKIIAGLAIFYSLMAFLDATYRMIARVSH